MANPIKSGKFASFLTTGCPIICKIVKTHCYPFHGNEILEGYENREPGKLSCFSSRIKLHNSSSQNRTLKAVVKTSSIYYNGVHGQLIRKSDGEFVMAPGQRNLHKAYFIRCTVTYINFATTSEFILLLNFSIFTHYYLKPPLSPSKLKQNSRA